MVRGALLASVVLASVGCSKGTKDTGSECAAAIAHGVDATIAKRRAAMDESRKAKGLPAEPADTANDAVPGKLKGVLGKLCVEDKWSADVIKCFQGTTDIGPCKEGLSPEQRSRYSREVMQVMLGGRIGKAGSGGPGMAMPPPPHGDGPAAGSAAPGSAVAP